MRNVVPLEHLGQLLNELDHLLVVLRGTEIAGQLADCDEERKLLLRYGDHRTSGSDPCRRRVSVGCLVSKQLDRFLVKPKGSFDKTQRIFELVVVRLVGGVDVAESGAGQAFASRDFVPRSCRTPRSLNRDPLREAMRSIGLSFRFWTTDAGPLDVAVEVAKVSVTVGAASATAETCRTAFRLLGVRHKFDYERVEYIATRANCASARRDLLFS